MDGSERMRLSKPTLLFVALLAGPAGPGAEPAQDPLRIVPTPTGCAVVLDNVPDEFRIDRLVDGGVTIGLSRTKLSAQERQMEGSCLNRFRISPSYDGQGSTLDLRPAGHEFSSAVRSGQSLKIAFEKVTDLGGPAASATDRSYRIGVGDQLEITVYNNTDLSKKATVGADGSLEYPLLGSVKAAGRTVREVQED